jgi:anti-sigma regulatory factor (Ser/Thr protein kinase)
MNLLMTSPDSITRMFKMKERLTINNEISSIAKTILHIINLIDTNKSISDKLKIKIELVMEEILTNICLHGKDISKIETLVKYDSAKNCIFIFIYDDSSIKFNQANPKHNLEKHGNKQLDENKKPIGHGLKLIDNFSDYHRHRQKNKGNINMVVFCESY